MYNPLVRLNLQKIEGKKLAKKLPKHDIFQFWRPLEAMRGHKCQQ